MKHGRYCHTVIITNENSIKHPKIDERNYPSNHANNQY